MMSRWHKFLFIRLSLMSFPVKPVSSGALIWQSWHDRHKMNTAWREEHYVQHFARTRGFNTRDVTRTQVLLSLEFQRLQKDREYAHVVWALEMWDNISCSTGRRGTWNLFPFPEGNMSLMVPKHRSLGGHGSPGATWLMFPLSWPIRSDDFAPKAHNEHALPWPLHHCEANTNSFFFQKRADFFCSKKSCIPRHHVSPGLRKRFLSEWSSLPLHAGKPFCSAWGFRPCWDHLGTPALLSDGLA